MMTNNITNCSPLWIRCHARTMNTGKTAGSPLGALRQLRHDVKELKSRDMKKAAAIEKIQQEIDKSKVA